MSRELLALHSPVLKAMFYGEFADKTPITLPGNKWEEIHDLQLFLIPTPTIKRIDDSNVERALKFSDEYQIEDLRERAESYLVLKMEACGNGSDQLLFILSVASKWCIKSILKDCIKRCAMEIDMGKLRSNLEDLRSEVIASLMVYHCDSNHRKYNFESICDNCGNPAAENACDMGGDKFFCDACTPLILKTDETVDGLLGRME